ncbi:MAG: hypothetical protein HZA52_05020 [Planctomycetes bacterium]|nr:hypothetical protein [Planctomycetota bacterium]
MSRIGRALVPLVFALATSACGDAKREPREQSDPGASAPSATAPRDGASTPNAPGAPAPIGKDAPAPIGRGAPTPIAHGAPTPIAKSVLVELCPPEVADWKLENVVGDEHPFGRGTFTSALAIYVRTRDEKAQELSLALIDGVRRPQAYASFNVAWGTQLENASLGYSRVSFGPDRGVQILSRHPLTVQVHVLVANRFLIQADTEKVEAEDVRAFVEALPLERIRALQ